MSKAISLKIKDDIFKEVEKITKNRHIPRNAYINDALSFYNKITRRNILKKKLKYESKLVEDNSLEVLKEFEKIKDPIFEWK